MCFCARSRACHNEKSVRRMASTTSDTGDTSVSSTYHHRIADITSCNHHPVQRGSAKISTNSQLICGRPRQVIAARTRPEPNVCHNVCVSRTSFPDNNFASCLFHAFSDVREPISLHQAVHVPSTHNRQSGFDLCYCQFHGLEVQSSDMYTHECGSS